MTLLQGISFSEIAALILIISTLGGALAWLIRQDQQATFLTKKAYYAQRNEDAAAAKLLKDVETADSKEHREKILAQITELNANMSNFMLKIAEWKADFHTRVSLLEDRQKRGRGSRRASD